MAVRESMTLQLGPGCGDRGATFAVALRRVLVALVLVFGCNLAVTPAEAQSAAGLIEAARKSIAKGKFKTAIRQLTRAMRVDDLSQKQLATAFLQRGIAYRENGSHAESIADITRALWLKGLSTADRRRALQSRAQSFQKLGFAQRARADFARAQGRGGLRRGGKGGTATAAAAVAGSGAAQKAASGSGGGLFGGLLSAVLPTGAKPTTQPAASAPLSGWDTAVKVKPAAAGGSTARPVSPGNTASVPRKRAAARLAAAKPTTWQTVSTRKKPAASAGGRFAVQVASVRSRKDAAALWARLQRRHGALLARRKPHIQRADLGAKGVFYRVQVHPPADRASARALCEALKAKGTYCVLTAR